MIENSPWVNIKYCDNPRLQKIIEGMLASATFSVVDDGNIDRQKFKLSARNSGWLEELELVFNHG